MTDFFDALERDLVAAARTEMAADIDGTPARARVPRGARRRAGRLAPALGVALALGVAGTGAAGTFYVLRSSPIAPFSPRDTVPDQAVAPGTSALLATRGADPSPAAPPWGLRVARSRTGLACVTVGQLRGGRFGIVGLDGRFRDVPAANADACSDPDAAGLSALGVRAFVGRRDRGARTVVYGVGGRDLQSVRLSLRGRPSRSVRPDAAGGFVVALRGYPEDLQPRLRLRWRDGRTRDETFAASPLLVADPLGGRAFALERGTAVPESGPSTSCVRFATARKDPGAPVASSPDVCGRGMADPTRERYFATRRLAGGGDWDGHAARVATWGSAGDATRVTAGVPGGPSRTVAVRAGAFLVLLPGVVDPEAVRVTLSGPSGTRSVGPDAGLVPSRRLP